MISKVIIGKSFSGICRYICADQKRAVVLAVEGVRSHDYRSMATDFDNQRARRPSLSNPVFHGILSFYPGEKISDTKMIEIAEEYLEKLGISETQFVITKRKPGEHKGKAIKDNWIGLKGKKVAQHLTIKYELTQATRKNLNLTHLEKMNEREANRYMLYQAISEKIRLCSDLDDLKRQIAKQGIETLYKYKGQTNELQGISFRIGDFKYKGSEIDRQCSLKQLERTLQLYAGRSMRQQAPVTIHITPLLEKLNVKENKAERRDIVAELMKPERNHQQPPDHWKMKKTKKRKPNGLHL
jgi:hypothetical protein